MKNTQSRSNIVADELRRHILSGRLSSGHHLPSVRQLARTQSISAFTAARVYDVLVAEGLVEARRGSGYYVARNVESLRSRSLGKADPLADSIWTLRREYDSQKVRVDAGCGWLPPHWLHTEGVRSALGHMARKPSTYTARYGSVYGLRALRRHLAVGLAHENIECTEEQVVLTQGASQALDLCIQALVQPGDCVLVDDPSYPYVLAMLRARGIRAIGVMRTAHGPDTAALRAILRTERPRAFITNTCCQNPTGTTISLRVAHEILLLAKEMDFLVIEDDIFAQLPAERPTSLASLGGLRHVVYIGSFSKTIAPNLRVGYLVADSARIQHLAALKNIVSIASSEIAEHVVLEILTSGRHRTHLERLRRRLAKARTALTSRLSDLGIEIVFRSEGMFLWGKLPYSLDSETIMGMAKKRGILLAPGGNFRPDGRDTGHYRFNVAYANDPMLYEFFESLPSATSSPAS